MSAALVVATASVLSLAAFIICGTTGMLTWLTILVIVLLGMCTATRSSAYQKVREHFYLTKYMHQALKDPNTPTWKIRLIARPTPISCLAPQQLGWASPNRAITMTNREDLSNVDSRTILTPRWSVNACLAVYCHTDETLHFFLFGELGWLTWRVPPMRESSLTQGRYWGVYPYLPLAYNKDGHYDT